MILLSSLVCAAQIQGQVYDLELNVLNNVKVEIDTVPKQILVVKDGSYAFDLDPGTYTITATFLPDDLKITEYVTIKDQGTYNLDLILFPNLDPETEILDEISEIDLTETFIEENVNTLGRLVTAIVLLGLVIAVVIIWFKFKKKTEEIKKDVKKQVAKVSKPAVPDDLKELVAFIKHEGGRTTQKEIRRQFPQSEAKISLMIAELEDKGIIKKIKKGRGNIIVFK